MSESAPTPPESKSARRAVRWLPRLLIFAGVPYLALATPVYLIQDDLLFYADATRVTDRLVEEAVDRHRAEVIEIDVDDGVMLHGVLLPATAAGADGPGVPSSSGAAVTGRPTVLYFGGNAETVILSSGAWGGLRDLGWNVVLVAYRGYGQSGGKPGARALLADALALHDAMAARAEVAPTRIATWGRSLGTGVAVHVAANRDVLDVVLVSPYARLSEPAAHHYPWLPVRLLFRHEIDSLALAPTLDTPALLYHGTRDQVIPSEQAQKLQAAWQPRPRLITLEGRGHNDVDVDPSYPTEAYRFLEGLR